MSFRVTVARDDLETLEDQGTIWAVTGTAEDGSRVTFAGDWRPMSVFLDAVESFGSAPAEVEDYQVLARGPASQQEGEQPS